MKTTKKIIVTLVILATANLMNADQARINFLNNQLISAIKHSVGIKAIKNLLNMGANPNAVDPYGRTPLAQAVINNNIEVAEELLKRGANVNAVGLYEQTPLHLATAYNYSNMIKLLLSYGANVNLKDKEGQTPKELAAEWETQDAAQALQDWEDFPETKGAHFF